MGGPRSSRRRLVAGLVVTAAAALAHAAPAAALNCDSLGIIYDSSKQTWHLRGDASTGTKDGPRPRDTVGLPTYDPSSQSEWNDLPAGAPEGCDYEDGGREVSYPFRTTRTDPSVQVAQKIFTPSAGPIFIRVLTLVRNVGSQPTTFRLWSRNEVPYAPSASRVVKDWSGDNLLTAADAYGVLEDAVDTDPRHLYGFAWEHSDPRRRMSPEAVVPAGGSGPVGNGVAAFHVVWRLDLAPGETKAVMQAAQATGDGPTGVPVLATTPLLADGPQELFRGLSDEESRALQNWVPPDADRDGVDNGTWDGPLDNCLYTPNSDQADADGDRTGNACDGDDDNDGLDDATELARGTAPDRWDTDGDGVGDPADACPLISGTGPDGCVVPPPPDRSAPILDLYRVPSKMRFSAFLKGVRCRGTANEPFALACRLVVRLPRKPASRRRTTSRRKTTARRSAKARPRVAGDLEVATKRVKLAFGRRGMVLKPRRRLLGSHRRFTATLIATATDGYGNRRTVRRTIRVLPDPRKARKRPKR